MPWGVFGVLLALVLLLQTSVLSVLGLRTIDLFLIYALVCGLVLPPYDARLAGWIIGFVQGLASAGMVMIHPVALGLTGLLSTVLRAGVNLDLWWVRLLVAFLSAWPGQLLVRIYWRFWDANAGDVLAPREPWWSILFGSAWVALAAGLIAAGLTALPALVTHRSRALRGARR